jgi:iron complex transport system substrate-binding protein
MHGFGFGLGCYTHQPFGLMLRALAGAGSFRFAGTLLACLVVTIAVGPGAWAKEVTDATGTQVKVAAHPMRIVTLAPSLGELAADLAEDDLGRIVGVSEYTDYPPRLARVESIGPYYRFNLEKVVALKPDVVLATLDGNPKDQVLHLRELGVPVVVVATGSFKEIGESISLIAQVMDAEKVGKQIRAQLERGVENFRARARTRPGRRVLLQIGDEPLVVVGRKSFLHEALEAIGSRNVYDDATAHYPRPSLEDAVHRDPDVIVVLALGKDLQPFYAMARRWEQFPALKAVKGGDVRVLTGDSILRPTLRLLEGLSILEKAVYGKK